jgi:hypothetical protein
MKAFAILVLVFAQPFLASAGFTSLKELSSHLFTNGPIVWQLQTNDLPKQFWNYQRHLPRIFSATVITNAIVLGSLQSKGFTGVLGTAFGEEGNADNFPPTAILRKSRQKYHSLTSYPDNGPATLYIGAKTLKTQFAIKLQQPNFYYVEWNQSVPSTFGQKTSKWE